MTDWHKIPRDQIEVAAAAGDEGAQAELRIHQRLDRAEDTIAGIRQDMNKTFDDLDAEIRDFQQKLKEMRDS